MVVLICPCCGAPMEIEENRKIAFCQYCGTKVLNSGGTVEINREQEINNLMLRALEFEQRRDYAKAGEYCERILAFNPAHAEARALEMRLPRTSAIPNVTIVYHSERGEKYQLRVTLDGRNWEVLRNNQSVSINLPRGKHRIHFSGTKTYNYDINIQDESRLITLVYTAGKHRNEITMY